MSLYAESSAVLSWLLGEPDGESARELLAKSDLVLTSELTLIECDRVLHRGVALGELAEGDAAERRARLAEAGAAWHRRTIDEHVVRRAREAFPVEPLRTLDALHVATALLVKTLVQDLQVLTFDDRIGECLTALGIPVVPDRGS